MIFTDIHGVILPTNRSFFAIGESFVLQCNTTPPNLPVMWERITANTNGSFVNLANDPRTTFIPPDNKTLARLANVTLSDTGNYSCLGIDPQLGGLMPQESIHIIPG